MSGLLLVLLASSLLAPARGQTAATLDPRQGSLPYDGHGALSAGASSRLLYDYAEPYRSDILDFLFKVGRRGELSVERVLPLVLLNPFLLC